jgi:hypothetical protein
MISLLVSSKNFNNSLGIESGPGALLFLRRPNAYSRSVMLKGSVLYAVSSGKMGSWFIRSESVDGLNTLEKCLA